MKKFYFLFSFLLINLLQSKVYSANTEKEILEFIIAGLKNRENSLYSIEGTFFLKVDIPVKSEREILWIKKGEKFRYEVKHLLESQKKHDRIYIFDGEKTILFHPSNRDAVITRRDLFPMEGITPLTLWLYEFQEKPISWWLSLPESKISLKGKEKIDGKECYLLEYYYKGYSGPEKLWVCPELDFAPIRNEGFAPPNVKGVYFLKDWTKINNIWIPKTAIYEIWELPDKLVHQVILEVKEIKINEEVKEESFKIEFPGGTTVTDEITGEIYGVPYKK